MTDSENSFRDTHFDEMTGLLFLEQQLGPEHSREISDHSKSCAACRELLRVLKNESVWLRGALTAEDEPIPARLVRVPARPATLWGWAAALGLSAAGIYTLWSWFVQPWTSQATDMGLTQGNVMSVLLFSGAFWSGWKQVADVVEFLAMITLGGVAVWLLKRYFRRETHIAPVMGAVALAMLFPWGTHAAETQHGTPNYTLPAGQEIKTDLFVAADHTVIDGDVDGDVIAWSHEVEINGHVKGDVIVFTQEVRVNGAVDGNVRAFAGSVVINANVARNLMAFAQSVEVGEKGGVGGSATLYSGNVQLNGPIKNDLLARIGTLDLNNAIGGNANIGGEHLNVNSTAVVAGRTQFTGREEPQVSPGAKLASPVEVVIETPTPRYSNWHFYWSEILRWGAAFLLGALMFLLAPGVFLDASNEAKRAGLAMGIGLLFLVGIPFAALIACITIVGLGIGIVTFLTYAVAVYMSQIFVGAWLGEKLLGAGVGIAPVLGRLALGLAILRLVRMLPFVGFASVWIVIFWGLGAYILTIHKRVRHQAAVAV